MEANAVGSVSAMSAMAAALNSLAARGVHSSRGDGVPAAISAYRFVTAAKWHVASRTDPCGLTGRLTSTRSRRTPVMRSPSCSIVRQAVWVTVLFMSASNQ